ncbi:helix-turn-helix transcriptional regulator [Pseudomonas granadensis]|jgi:PAS domain S-box-containing protein|uniref:Helix-turn-helix transcriptional regulator n=1 Tax=Pseudomonas granadensis TaxID=1421430 RepID=A0ABX7GMG0_9PSED|nr:MULTISPECIES: helix-turn-helix transcriptional regulator [Pseudomonas]MBN6772672.1 helix-turn-helix transcriptional regulator [Pseudomonas granadensis]MBN6806388.1 helix-turn-helix transcriptional regulator [Pseudomonas granadensis]MBN6830967.1 helix-turn-helix transcriptional regulator [Pseudomonas granadensis]MBN6840751.1 helix-turn-helix transcriptional regulator [Pseudomonas granadensis]MBN6867871.1 helix-turn-helix transcriptional regulator [Pseudomonas granadensis]
MSQEVLTTETNRRQLQQIIAGLSDGVILLELDQSILWANEAALAMHGVSRIGELGSNAEEYAKRFSLRYRNNHTLPPENYPISRVARCEMFSDVLIEVSPADDPERIWVHSVRSMVLTDRLGQPESLVLIMSDVTDWANAEQRFEKTFNANPAPAVICRLSDLRYIKVNPGFLEMTGYSREQVIGTSAYEIDIFEQAEKRDLAIQRLRDVATIPQMQAELRLPDGGSKQVIVAGQPLLLNDENCMLFSFVDMEPRRKVELALRQSEERFAKAFRLTPVPILICSADQQEVIDVNQAFLETLAYEADDVLGKTVTQLKFIDDEGERTRLLAALANNARVDRVDVRVRKRDDELLECAVSADTVKIHDTSCYLLVLMDMTERKRSELELVAAIEEVMKDASWFSRTLIEKLANVKKINSPQLPSASFTDLTARERDVLGLICEGLADKEIAARLKLAPNTVRNHVATVYSKLDVHSRSEAIVWARERGLFSGEWGAKGQR